VKVLITGITGFVGSWLAEYLLDKADIVGIVRVRSNRENIAHIEKDLNLEYGDLLDRSSLDYILKKHKPDVIHHLAAQSYVPFSTTAPNVTYDNNIIGTSNLLESVRWLELDPIIHICSSSEVYGKVRPEDIPITEECPLNPVSPYAVSKVGEDMLGRLYYENYGMRTIVTRMFTHTGPRRGEVFVMSNFAKQIAEIEKGKREVLEHGNLDSVRTWLDVKDAVRAYHKLWDCPAGEVYNIGGVESMTICEMLDKLCSLSTHVFNCEMNTDRLRPTDVTMQIPCIDKFTKQTGWKPEIPFSQTLEDTLNYWRGRV